MFLDCRQVGNELRIGIPASERGGKGKGEKREQHTHQIQSLDYDLLLVLSHLRHRPNLSPLPVLRLDYRDPVPDPDAPIPPLRLRHPLPQVHVHGPVRVCRLAGIPSGGDRTELPILSSSESGCFDAFRTLGDELPFLEGPFGAGASGCADAFADFLAGSVGFGVFDAAGDFLHCGRGIGREGEDEERLWENWIGAPRLGRRY